MTTEISSPAEEINLANLSEEEARELEQVLEKLNQTALEMVARLDRIHWLAQDIVRDLRGARGLPSKEENHNVPA